MSSSTALRWTLAGDEAQTTLFDDGLPSGARDLPAVEYMHVRARTIISTVPPQSRMPFRHTINAYRGCTHACVYCFARPTHPISTSTPGSTSSGDRRQGQHRRALRAELAREVDGDHVAIGADTDPYQPAEGRYRLRGGSSRTLPAQGHTLLDPHQSTMILRDIDLLVGRHGDIGVRVDLSIGTLRRACLAHQRAGPRAPAQRVETVRRLVDADTSTACWSRRSCPASRTLPSRLEGGASVRASTPAPPPSRPSSCICDPASRAVPALA